MSKEKISAEELQKQIKMSVLQARAHLPYGDFFRSTGMLDLFDANIQGIDFGSQEKDLEWLERIARATGSCKAKYEKSLTEVVTGIIQAETNFDIGKYELYTSAEGGRGAIRDVASKLVSPSRPYIAYGSPNWIFEKVTAKIPGARDLPFFAPSANDFVEGFDRVSRQNNVAALIVVDPANPLGYRLERKHIEDLERIAESKGSTIIFDDVFRGLQKKGDRHSSSEYSTSAVIVETTSKRFSAMGRGVTWALVPRHLRLGLNSLDASCEGCSAEAVLITDAMYSCEIDTRIAEILIQRKKAFERGFRDFTGASKERGNFFSAFEGMPLFLYRIPQDEAESTIEKRLEWINLAQELRVTSGLQWICNLRRDEKIEIPEKEIILGTSYLRICPTKENSTNAYSAGRMLGDLIKKRKSK